MPEGVYSWEIIVTDKENDITNQVVTTVEILVGCGDFSYRGKDFSGEHLQLIVFVKEFLFGPDPYTGNYWEYFVTDYQD